MKAIVGGKLLLESAEGGFCVREDAALLFDERIRKIVPREGLRYAADLEIIDAAGLYVSPGFLNLHVHGCGGADTMDEAAGSLIEMSRWQARMGVVAFLPTTMTYDFSRLDMAFCHVRRAMQEKLPGAAVLGCNMEGPFISPQKKGAQAAKDIIRADFRRIEAYQDIIRIITIAPEELAGDYTFLAKCREQGIIVSLGHSMAGYELADEVMRTHGVRHVTHLFNAMPPLHHRKPGLAGAALLAPEVCCELIADNIHVHPAMQRLIYRLKGAEHLLLITDSLRACGLGEGESELGGQRVFVKGGRAELADGTLAGSVLTMDRAIDNFREAAEISLPEAVRSATQTPARELGLYGEYGVIREGARADLVLFDEKISVRATIIRGKTIFRDEI